ncbi:MAG TPA: A24 family peptidase [Steroidobacteraceae bacterium]|jgi:leader peptidase (prepilin peptidase)/N-methyltransferase
MPLTAALSSSPPFFIAMCLILGLIVGSFLNVVIHRLPIMLEREWREQCEELAREHAAPVPHAASAPHPAREPYNLVVPRSACPTCKAPIRAWQNVPIVSWLLLRGRCAACGARVSVRYPLVEALTGVLSAAVAWKLGFGWPAAAALVLTWFLVALAFIDVDHQLLPDNLTLPLLWLGLLLSLWGPQPGGAPVPVDLRSSLIGAAAGYLSLWCVFHAFRLLTGKEGMGYGDFKLLAALGAWLGWQMLLPVILVAAAVGAVTGIVILAVQGKDRSTPIPFGPYLAAAGWLMLLFGHELVARYLGLFGAR